MLSLFNGRTMSEEVRLYVYEQKVFLLFAVSAITRLVRSRYSIKLTAFLFSRQKMTVDVAHFYNWTFPLLCCLTSS